MKQDVGFELSQGSCTDRPRRILWKRTALAVISAALVIGMSGCSLDDLLAPIDGDIPFGTEQTNPPDMGAVDNTPTVPEDDSPWGDDDFRPV